MAKLILEQGDVEVIKSEVVEYVFCTGEPVNKDSVIDIDYNGIPVIIRVGDWLTDSEILDINNSFKVVLRGVDKAETQNIINILVGNMLELAANIGEAKDLEEKATNRYLLQVVRGNFDKTIAKLLDEVFDRQF